jgi:hypothetical protein
MAAQKPRPAPRPPAPQPSGDPGVPGWAVWRQGWQGWLVRRLAGTALAPLTNLFAVIFLGVAGILLSFAWQTGPQRLLDAAKYSHLTSRASGRVVESWLAIEWNAAEMGEGTHWRGAARATPCLVVEYAGDWGAPARRAFCGNRLPFHEGYSPHALREMAPGVPFLWQRDERGFILPEIRLAASSRQWLATHPPAPSPLNVPPATALAELRDALDRPVDAAIAGWSAPPADFPLALDPRQPREAWPASFVASRRELRPEWGFFPVAAAMGLYLWLQGLTALFGKLPRAVMAIVAGLSLLTLPWWAEQLPLGLRALSPAAAGIFADLLGDLDPAGRLKASEPAAATLAGGERMIWRAGDEPYAATFGRFRYALPAPPPESADAALAALAVTVAEQARTLSDAERSALFAHLAQDKAAERTAAGFAFLPAAKEALLDPRGDPALRKAAAGFLAAWVTQPVEDPWPKHLAFRQRIALDRELMDLPMTEIAVPAGSIVERAESRR